ncbi:MAG: Transcriptional regulator, TetR family [Pseudonocardiales bacterium]|nr:Transcriptional regulator, TetR family [Pseudonocardiales bacterium]
MRNRSALITAARDLFGRRGLDVPLDDIAKQAGVSNATLYRHFSGRRALLAEVVVASLHRHEVALAAALSQPNGWDGLVFFLEFLFGEQVAEVEHLGALRAIPASENEDVDRLRTHTLEGFTELIRRAKDEGSFRADRFAEDLYLMLFVNEQLSHLGETPQRAASRRLLELTLAAITTRAGDGSEALETPEDVMTLRHTLGHDLAGLPRLA